MIAVKGLPLNVTHIIPGWVFSMLFCDFMARGLRSIPTSPITALTEFFHTDSVKTSLTIFLPLTVLQGFENVVWGLRVIGSRRSNITAIFWPLTLMAVTSCLSCSLVLLNRRPRAHSSGPKAPSAWCGPLYHTSSPTVWNSTGNCSGSSNSTELYNRSTPTRSLKSNV